MIQVAEQWYPNLRLEVQHYMEEKIKQAKYNPTEDNVKLACDALVLWRKVEREVIYCKHGITQLKDFISYCELPIPQELKKYNEKTQQWE